MKTMAAAYRLTDDPDMVVRTSPEPHSDAAITRQPEGNDGWAEYEAWLAAGGVPDPYVAPPPPINPALDYKPAKTTAQILGVA